MLLLTEQLLDFHFRFGELRQGDLSLSRTDCSFSLHSLISRVLNLIFSVGGAEVTSSGGWAVIFVGAGVALGRLAGLVFFRADEVGSVTEGLCGGGIAKY